MASLDLLNNFHFIRPEWLLAIIPCLLILTWLRLEKRSQGDWQTLIPEHLLEHLIEERPSSSSSLALSLLAVIWLIAVLAMAGPSWEKTDQPVYQKLEARVYVLDLSYSMYSADIKPDRITRARLKLIDMLNSKREGLSALVVFSGGAHVVTPLTSDTNTIVSLVPALEPKIMPHHGSNAKEAIVKAIELLRNSKLDDGEIILISDEVLLNDRQNINALLEKTPYTLSILGIGTSEGAPIKLPNGQFLKDKQGSIVIPKLNSNELSLLAKNNAGRYSLIQNSDKDINYLLAGRTLDEDKNSQETEERFDIWFDAGQWLMFPILLLAALAFRRGWVLSLALLISFGSSSFFPNPVYAETTAEMAADQNAAIQFWNNLWKTPDQQGIEHFKQGDFAGAAEDFSNPNWQAASRFYNGQFAEAAEQYKNLSEDKGKPNEDQADNYYNLGNALARAGDLNGALKAYNQSLALRPEDEDTLFNRDLVENLKNNPPEQNQQNSVQQNSDQQNSDQQNSDQQNSDQQNSDQQNSDQQNSDQQNSDQQNSDQQNSDQQNSDQQNSDQQNSDQQNSDQQNSDQQNSDQQNSDQQDPNQENAQYDSKENNDPASNGDNDNESESENKQGVLSEEDQNPLDREKQQALEQWLRQVPDDPSGLMRRKFELENQRRQNRNNDQQAW